MFLEIWVWTRAKLLRKLALKSRKQLYLPRMHLSLSWYPVCPDTAPEVEGFDNIWNPRREELPNGCFVEKYIRKPFLCWMSNHPTTHNIFNALYSVEVDFRNNFGRRQKTSICSALNRSPKSAVLNCKENKSALHTTEENLKCVVGWSLLYEKYIEFSVD